MSVTIPKRDSCKSEEQRCGVTRTLEMLETKRHSRGGVDISL